MAVRAGTPEVVFTGVKEAGSDVLLPKPAAPVVTKRQKILVTPGANLAKSVVGVKAVGGFVAPRGLVMTGKEI
jgi:hypothetical protein